MAYVGNDIIALSTGGVLEIDTALYPIEAEVKTGTVYGDAGQYTGSYAGGSDYLPTLWDCNIFDIKAGEIGGTGYLNFWHDNIFINGASGLSGAGSSCFAVNNIFYNQTTAGINLQNASDLVYEFNNLYVLPATSDFAVYISDSKGSVSYSDYGAAYCSAGAVTNPWYDDTNDVSIIGANSVNGTDPQLTDPANGDFTVGNWQLMETGKPGPGGNPTHMGAVGKPSAYDIIVAELQ